MVSAIKLNYYLTRRRALPIVVIQFIMVLFCAYVGINDTTSSLTFAGRIRGGLFLIVAIALVIGIVAIIGMLTNDNPQWGPPALAGSIFSFVVGASMVIIQSVAVEHVERLPIWIVVSLACLWCVLTLLRSGAVLQNPGRLAAVLSVSTLLSAANFLYPNVYQPSTAPYLLQLSLDYGKPIVNDERTMLAIPITIKARNPAAARVYVVGSTFAISGRKTKYVKNGAVGVLMQDAVRNRAPLQRYVKTIGYDVLTADEFISAGFYFEAGEERVTRRIVEIPVKNPYQTLRLDAEALVVRGDRVVPTLAEETVSWDDKGNPIESLPSWMNIPSSSFVHWTFSLKEASAIAKLTREPLALNVWWVLEEPEIARPRGSYLVSLISAEKQQDRKPPASMEERSSNRYGLQSTGTYVSEISMYELTLNGATK
jgi:hypothetical protein